MILKPSPPSTLKDDYIQSEANQRNVEPADSRIDSGNHIHRPVGTRAGAYAGKVSAQHIVSIPVHCRWKGGAGTGDVGP